RLGDTNYNEWAIRMEATLVRKGYWSLIQHDLDLENKTDDEAKAAVDAWKKKRSASKMGECCAEIILRVEDSQLSHIRSRDPLEVWNELERVHRARGFATRLALRRKFLSSKKPDSMSMQSWIG
ncbi:hypothetical protein BDN72DRAFT_746508, partial [Pluteus cervinus]